MAVSKMCFSQFITFFDHDQCSSNDRTPDRVTTQGAERTDQQHCDPVILRVTCIFKDGKSCADRSTDQHSIKNMRDISLMNEIANDHQLSSLLN